MARVFLWSIGRIRIVREGRTIGAVITFIDITERKQTEEALRRSEEQNRSLLQINNAIITNLTQEALLHSISEALHRFIGFDRCAITLYQPDRDTFRFLAVEGELASDYFQTGMETGAAKPAWVGFTTTRSPGSAAISRNRPHSRMNAGLPPKGFTPYAFSPWLSRESASARSAL